jgi:RHS repeat-associated protein
VATNIPAGYSNAGLYLNHADWLGTERARTNASGATAEQSFDSPFGMNLQYSPTDLSPMHFTGKQHDPESGLDNFGARYYGSSNALGRFITPDVLLADQSVEDPQSWNLYAYVRNNPLSFWDPTGLACVVGPNGEEYDDTSGGQTCQQAHEADKNKNPDATVTATPDPVNTEDDSTSVAVYLVEMKSPANNDSWGWTFTKSFFSWQPQEDAWNKGYYKCLGKKAAGGAAAPVVTHPVGVAATNAAERGASTIAGAYYHVTDARFTAWGKYSQVLVPNLAPKIATAAKALDAVGWAYFDYELANAIRECSEVLQ